MREEAQTVLSLPSVLPPPSHNNVHILKGSGSDKLSLSFENWATEPLLLSHHALFTGQLSL